MVLLTEKIRGQLRENLAKIRQRYYWSLMIQQFKQNVKNFNICSNNKYESHLELIPLGEAPVPEKEGEQLLIETNII